MLNEDSGSRASEREVLFGQTQKELTKTDMSRMGPGPVPSLMVRRREYFDPHHMDGRLGITRSEHTRLCLVPHRHPFISFP